MNSVDYWGMVDNMVSGVVGLDDWGNNMSGLDNRYGVNSMDSLNNGDNWSGMNNMGGLDNWNGVHGMYYWSWVVLDCSMGHH